MPTMGAAVAAWEAWDDGKPTGWDRCFVDGEMRYPA